MLKVQLTDRATNKQLHTETGYRAGKPTLVVESDKAIHGTFKAASRSSAGTSVVTAPLTDGSILLTDIFLTADKVNAATVTVHFTDGSNTVVIVAADVTDGPCNIGTSLAGRWQGWKDARVELVTTGAVTTTLALGYVKIPVEATQAYAAWDAAR